MTTLNSSIVKAKKQYTCDACILFDRTGLDQSHIAPEDWRLIEKAREEKCKILPGSLYKKVIYKDGGKLETYRARVEIDALIDKYELLDEE